MQEVAYELLNIKAEFLLDECIIRLQTYQGHEGDTLLHWHDGIELTLLLEGEIQYWIAGKEYKLCPEEMAFVNSGAIHRAWSEEGGQTIRALILVIPNQVLFQLVPNSSPIHFEIRELEQRRLVVQMSRIAEQMLFHRPYYELLVKRDLIDLVYLLFTDCAKKSERIEEVPMEHKMLQYINLNYAKDLTVTKMAEWIGFQEKYFCRFFRKRVGVTFHYYLSKVRLDAALALYTAENYSVLQCAIEAGFSSPKVMNDWCKKIYGCTPREYVEKPALRTLS